MLIGLLIVPPIVREANQLADDAAPATRRRPRLHEEGRDAAAPGDDYGITTKLQEEAKKLPDKLGGAAGTLGDIGLSLVNSLFAALNILILSIFMVGGGRRWLEWFITRSDPEHQPRLRRILDQVRRAVAATSAGRCFRRRSPGVTTSSS